MSKKGLCLSSVLGLTVALSVAGSAAHAQTPSSTYTPPTGADPSPSASTEPSAGTTLAQPAPVAPTLEIEPLTSTEDRVDQDRWRFPNRPLVITGSSVLALSYAPVAIAGAASDELSKNVYYPVAGPWLEIAQEPGSTTETTLLAIDGVFQGLGALALVSGFVIPERKTRNWYLIGNERVSLLPRLSPRNLGLAAFARF